MSDEVRSGANSTPVESGPFLAKVVSVLDPTYMGSLEVQLLHEVGNDENTAGQTRVVKYLSPFYGVTNIQYVTEDADVYQETQKAYGMWMIPPDVGTLVMCIFIGGDVRKGYWMGCVQDENMNFSVPGYAATSYVVDDSRKTALDNERVPVGEYNKIINSSTQDPTKIPKPEHPFAKVLQSQGLLKDDARGITTSSARRDIPSMVFGISTPGPVDKNGKIGKFGKKEHLAKGFVSRLGGSSFVMDDGDDKFLRKTSPSEGPPVYANVENDEDDGINTIPHNELIRLRTRTGHQILLHNSEDLIYIGNSKGSAWIELTSDGKIDIFSSDSISVRTKQDFNFYCDRDFNLDVKRNFNLKVKGEWHTNVGKDQILIVDRDQKIFIKNRKDETIDEQYRQTVKKDVKKYYAEDYVHNIDGRTDIRIAKGCSVTIGDGPSEAKFAPYDKPSQDPENPIGNDNVTSDPVKDINGATPDRIDLNFFLDTRKKIKGNLDIKVTGNIKTTNDGNIETNANGNILETSGGSNQTKAGGEIIEKGSQIHMNGKDAAVAEKAEEAEEARISAKSTIPLYLKTHTLPNSPQKLNTILRRVPTAEPYQHHENLEPKKFKPKKSKESPGTDRDSDNRYRPAKDKNDANPTTTLATAASGFSKYSTNTDTFEKVTAPEEPEE